MPPHLTAEEIDALAGLVAADESDGWECSDVAAGPVDVIASDGDAVATAFGNAAHGVDGVRRGQAIAALRNAAPKLLEAARVVEALRVKARAYRRACAARHAADRVRSDPEFVGEIDRAKAELLFAANSALLED